MQNFQNNTMTNNTISRVSCSVSTCAYNQNSQYCTAPSIQIKAHNASTAEETDCATFVKR
ncbi:protein of unknown function [Alkalithermobacter thermoalcaliphilus JW-YL-7 = DSM 7308]|uniref:DUF1540 domain-containing protein n=1 Tax=Alkalithermobacter thermoalcaliphilus JW-YL-7 = DSM 7308 TaxID=1121328 RepID=A0A150FRD5_CLOPD|nr:protein of unknown function DUF1540 [[Clostridium] paradoxum JW-YL-7 = DSM 7308]SHL03253.1 protein of unknown function [[Clostridium] paradoxum JW-YL-7 = DSM 7308]